MGKFDWEKEEVEAFPVYGLKTFLKNDFRFVQTQDNRLFISGGFFSKKLHEAYEVEGKQIKLKKYDKMKYGRKGHSLNVLGDKYLIATGGRSEDDKYLNSCELFDIES